MKISFALLVSCLFVGSVGYSQPGALDGSFGNGGKVITSINDSASTTRAVAVQTDGKIVVAGSSTLAGQNIGTLIRYHTDGSIDSTFGTGGKVLSKVGVRSDIYDVAIQPDGKIIIGGSATLPDTMFTGKGYFLLIRYNTNGSIDTTFGNNGITTTGFPDGSGVIRKMLIKPNGKIIVGGVLAKYTFEGYSQFAQYENNGALDTTFGYRGTLIWSTITPPGSKAIAVNDIALTADGKIVAVIEAEPQGQLIYTDFILTRLLPNGSTDSTFGTSGTGVVLTDINNVSGDNATSLVILPDSTIIVGGYSYKPSLTKFALAKYHADGIIDNSFGTAGKVITSVNNITAVATDLQVDLAGNLVLTGNTFYTTEDFALAKYSPNGNLDNTFGNQGIVTTDFLGFKEQSFASAIQPDGKIIVVGEAADSRKTNFAIARYNSTIFPVHLLTFTARFNQDKVNLNWKVENEQNFDKYEIERSFNSKEFNKIGTVKAINAKSYSFIDETYSSNGQRTTNNSLFYRLKMLDKDGKFSYSKIEKVTLPTHNPLFNLFPNPASNKVELQLSKDIKGKVTVEVIDATGKIVVSKAYEVVGNNISLSTEKLATGNYHVKMRYNDEQYVQKLVVVR